MTHFYVYLANKQTLTVQDISVVPEETKDNVVLKDIKGLQVCWKFHTRLI